MIFENDRQHCALQLYPRHTGGAVPLRFFVKTAITVATPPVVYHSFPSSSSSSLGSRCVPWLGEGLSMSSPNDPVLCCPLPYRVAPVFVQIVSPPLGWSPLTYFLVIWSPSGDARGPSVVFEAVDMPCPGPFHFSHSVDYIYEFCPLPNPDVGPSIFVCDVEHTSFHFGLCGRKFVLCLFGQCPGLCTICHSFPLPVKRVCVCFRGSADHIGVTADKEITLIYNCGLMAVPRRSLAHDCGVGGSTAGSLRW